MKNNYLKKLIQVLLLIFIVINLFACGNKIEKYGLLGDFSDDTTNYIDKIINKDGRKILYQEYENITTLLLALKSKKVSHVVLDETTAKYYSTRQPQFFYNVNDNNETVKYSMCFLEDKKELCDQISNVILQLKNEGYLEQINKSYITDIINGVDSGETYNSQKNYDITYKIGITGDLPPMDFINPEGLPCGFNVVLLNEISKRLKINFEIVNLDTGSKASALSSNKVDGIFWIRSFDENINDSPLNTIFTTPYYESKLADLIIK